MATKAKRTRIKNYVQYVHEDSAVYATDPITPSKPKVPAEVMVELKENERIARTRCCGSIELKREYNEEFIKEFNTLIPRKKVWRMLVKALNKGKAFTYRNLNLSAEQHLDTTPANKPVNLTQQFIRKQFESKKNYGKRVNKNTQAGAQVSILQVA